MPLKLTASPSKSNSFEINAPGTRWTSSSLLGLTESELPEESRLPSSDDHGQAGVFLPDACRLSTMFAAWLED